MMALLVGALPPRRRQLFRSLLGLTTGIVARALAAVGADGNMGSVRYLKFVDRFRRTCITVHPRAG